MVEPPGTTVPVTQADAFTLMQERTTRIGSSDGMFEQGTRFIGQITPAMQQLNAAVLDASLQVQAVEPSSSTQHDRNCSLFMLLTIPSV